MDVQYSTDNIDISSLFAFIRNMSAITYHKILLYLLFSSGRFPEV